MKLSKLRSSTPHLWISLTDDIDTHVFKVPVGCVIEFRGGKYRDIKYRVTISHDELRALQEKSGGVV